MNTGLLQPRINEVFAANVGKRSLSRQRHPPRCVSAMEFYLVRHGDALSATENPRRPLSPEGRRRVAQTARSARERGIQVSTIYHSGILRAAETAEILARHFPSVERVAQLSGLLPDDDPAIIKTELDLAADSLMLVGHLPFMSRLTGLLLHGDSERPAAEFLPASMVCCVKSATEWKIRWQIAP
jgi:phosphohistidine phosphatase